MTLGTGTCSASATSTLSISEVRISGGRDGFSVYQDGNISTDLVRNFCLRTDCFRDLFTQRYASFSTAQAEVNLPHAALERVKYNNLIFISRAQLICKKFKFLF